MLTALIGVKPPAKLLAVFGKRQRQFAPECARLSQALLSILGASLYGLLVASALPVCGQTSNSDASVSTASASV